MSNENVACLMSTVTKSLQKKVAEHMFNVVQPTCVWVLSPNQLLAPGAQISGLLWNWSLVNTHMYV